MAITDFDSFVAKRTALRERVLATKASIVTSAGRRSSLWTAAPFAGATPSTAAVPTRATAGALGQQNGGGTALRATLADLGSTAVGSIWLCDRLSHQGGLVGDSASAQTTNLPTAALTRYTTGAGVHALLEVYSIVGTTATTFTTSYTNQDGTSGRTSIASTIGGVGFREVGRAFDIPLQLSDSGVRAVASVTLAATTGTAGNFGVTLYKPLLHFPIQQALTLHEFDPLLALSANLPEIIDDACLFWLVRPVSTASGIIVAQLGFAEDDT